ncbi:MAG: hypothetical protein JTT11_00805 [Candidatus Brockarchaeota archaeon]|nr:hypothetical protein [Candidatus Brockarchaeota archaeon]
MPEDVLDRIQKAIDNYVRLQGKDWVLSKNNVNLDVNSAAFSEGDITYLISVSRGYGISSNVLADKNKAVWRFLAK